MTLLVVNIIIIDLLTGSGDAMPKSANDISTRIVRVICGTFVTGGIGGIGGTGCIHGTGGIKGTGSTGGTGGIGVLHATGASGKQVGGRDVPLVPKVDSQSLVDVWLVTHRSTDSGLAKIRFGASQISLIRVVRRPDDDQESMSESLPTRLATGHLRTRSGTLRKRRTFTRGSN